MESARRFCPPLPRADIAMDVDIEAVQRAVSSNIEQGAAALLPLEAITSLMLFSTRDCTKRVGTPVSSTVARNVAKKLK